MVDPIQAPAPDRAPPGSGPGSGGSSPPALSPTTPAISGAGAIQTADALRVRAESMGAYIDDLERFLLLTRDRIGLVGVPSEALVAAFHGWRIETRQKNDRAAASGAPPIVPGVGANGQGPSPAPQRAPEKPAAPAPAPAQSAPPGVCKVHRKPWKLVPAGVSRASGRAYAAFWACSERDCREKPSRGGQGGGG